jgi:acetyl esterase/lipase
LVGLVLAGSDVLKGLVGIIALFAILGIAAWHSSPWPSALFYRLLFDKAGIAVNRALARHVPAGVTVRSDISYGSDPSEKLDVYLPPGVEGSGRALPMVLWVHGGGFLAGDKGQIANYLKIVAAAGYAVAGINYTLTPSARHPRPAQQANAALAFIKANAATLDIDIDRVFLAGDSAGSHIAAQLAIALSEPDYARSLGITPALPLTAVRGLVLHCGIYDPDIMSGAGSMAGFVRTVSWAYLGSKEVGGPATPREFSIVRNLTKNMPPMFITAGNADPLLPHSKSLAAAATALGVTVDALFFPEDYSPPLQHEYEFDLDSAAGREALKRSLKFIAERAQ